MSKSRRLTSSTRRSRNTPKGYIDLLTYIKTRSHISTRRAMTVARSRVLEIDGEPIGYNVNRNILGQIEWPDRYIPVEKAGVGGVNIKVNEQRVRDIQGQILDVVKAALPVVANGS